MVTPVKGYDKWMSPPYNPGQATDQQVTYRPVGPGRFLGPRPLSPAGQQGVQTAQLGGMNQPLVQNRAWKPGDPVDLRPAYGNNMPMPTPTGGQQVNMGQAVQQPVQQTAQQPMQQYGLSGAESALTSGLNAGINALGQGQGNALNTLNYGNQLAQGQLGQGVGAINQGVQSALAQIAEARKAAGQQIGQGVNALRQGETRGLGAIDSAINQGVQPLQGFVEPGQQSQQLQAALSGALGPQAQQEAYANFNSSPGQDWLRKQGEQSLINQGAATGGLGGGDIKKRLLEYGQGLAQQDYQNQFNNLGQITGTGLNAANSIGNLYGQKAGLSSNLIGQTAQGIGNLYGQGASISGNLGQAGANIENSGGANIANLLGQGAGISSNLASQGAGIYSQTGQNAANMFNNAGNNIANARFTTGQNISNNIGNTTTGLANLINSQGSGLSDIIGSNGINIANLLSGAGQAGASQQQDLATLLANLSVGSGSNLSGIQQNSSQIAQTGANQQGQQQAQTGGAIIGALASMFSDIRLKDDVRHVGNIGGYDLFQWVWKDTDVTKDIAGKKEVGFIAQLVEMINPGAVIQSDSGYKMINLGAL